MRVALISYYYPEYLVPLANALISQGVQLLLLISAQSVEPFRQNLAPEVECQPFQRRRLRDPLSALKAWEIVRAIRTWQPDVIHLQQGHLWFNLVGLPLLRGRPLVTTIHDVISHLGDRYSERVPQWVWNIAFRQASHLIVHGQKLKQDVAARHRIDPGCIHVIPHGEFAICTQWAQPDQAEQDNVLFFGRIWPYKGLQYLLQAEPLITAQVPTARIVIAGEGENIENYRHMIVNQDRVVIDNRFIPMHEIAGFFQRAAVVALPYVEASQSGVIPLAYAFGKPVVATTVGSIPEVVDHGQTGYLVPPRDAAKLAEAIVSLLKDPALRNEMGQQGFQKAMTDLSWERIAKSTIQVYQAAIGQ